MSVAAVIDHAREFMQNGLPCSDENNVIYILKNRFELWENEKMWIFFTFVVKKKVILLEELASEIKKSMFLSQWEFNNGATVFIIQYVHRGKVVGVM